VVRKELTMPQINKVQLYIWDDNLEFLKDVKNKSKLVNLLLRKYREETE
jgi:hypothetical protein